MMKVGLRCLRLLLLSSLFSPFSLWAMPIDPGFDLFATDPGTTFVDIGGTSVPLMGVPFHGDVDTIVERTGPGPLAPGDTGSFDIELVALSLMSVDPVDLGGGMMADIYAVRNDLGLPGIADTRSLLGPAPVGEMDILSHDDTAPGGGEFMLDAILGLPVEALLIFTTPGGDPNDPGDDVIAPQLFNDVFFSTAPSLWSHTPRFDDPVSFRNQFDLPSGGFYPGVSPGPGIVTGAPPQGEKVLDPETAALAAHGVLPGQVPEPSTILLLGLGALGLAGRRRRLRIQA